MSLMYKKVTSTLKFDKENPKTVYKLANQRQSKVKFTQLLQDVHRAAGVNKAQTQAVIEGLIDSLSHFLDLGHTVQMGGFGTFRPYFLTKTQANIEDVSAENIVRCKIQFYPGKALRDVMKNITIEDAEPADGDDNTDENESQEQTANETGTANDGGNGNTTVTPITPSGNGSTGGDGDGGDGGDDGPTED